MAAVVVVVVVVVVVSMVAAAAASTVGAEASVAAVLLADTMVAEHTSMVAEHASMVAEHASTVADRVFQGEASILWLAALASRHLGCVRRQRFGRIPLQAIEGSQAGQMLHLERLTIAEAVSELSGRLRALNQDTSVARTSTAETTSSRATTVIGIAIGIGAVPIIGITAGGVTMTVTG
jgi:hypothetical protein